MDYLGWLVLALIAAAGVLVTAAVVSNERENAGRGLSGFFADLRAGLSSLVNLSILHTDAPDDSGQVGAYVVNEVSGDVDMDDFFAAQEHSGQSYLQAEDITSTLQKARVAIRTHMPAMRPRSEGLRTTQVAGSARHASGVSGHVPAGSGRAALAHSQRTS